ncbi:MAG: rRNA maturation RNase YbeY [Eubacterium sp.]|jgi:probable rRNA maturation factor|nr:rRNA maturation RNase YbeY [Eubacterium sp.]
MTVYFEDEAGISFGFDPEEKVEEVIAFVRDHVECPYDIEVSVTLVDTDTIRQVNSQFRQIEKVTDVLSFPMMEYDSPRDFGGQAFQNSLSLSPDTQEMILGDILLCSEVVKTQAEEYGHSELREFCFLVVHSMLHLFGYDHIQEEDRREMEEEQRKIMERLGINR